MNRPEILSAAVSGAYGVFSVTNCPCPRCLRCCFCIILANSVLYISNRLGEQRCSPVEITRGKAVTDAGRAAGVSLFIWSSLPNVTKFSNGELTTVHHSDSKAEDYIRTLPFPSCVFIMTAFFMQNIWSPIKAPPKVVS